MFRDYKAVKEFVEHGIYDTRVLVIGDIMIDKYYYSEVSRICPEAPVPVARVVREKMTLGGAANVAHNLARAGCRTSLCGIAGQDENCGRLIQMLDELNVAHDGIVVDKRPTTAKARVIGGNQQMIRLDFEDSSAISSAVEHKISAWVARLISEIDGIIVSDYGKGLCTAGLCKEIIRQATQKKLPVFVDPKGSHWHKYSGAFCITPNVKELSEVAGRVVANDDKEVIDNACKIQKKYKLEYLLVTRSERGMTLVDSAVSDTLSTRAQEVFDVSGAGDTVIAFFAAAICGGLCAHDAAQLANYAAGIEVGKLGTYAVSNEEIVAVLKQIEG